MSKIATYGLADSPLQLSDRLIGTEAPRPQPSVTPLATKNFSLGELLQLFSSNFPAASLQAVLDTGNTATQDITLTGTITSSVIKPDEIEDAVGSQGAEFQFLSKAASGINWVDLPVYIPTLDEVLTAGNDSLLNANINELGLWDNFTPTGYAKIYANKNRINFEGKSGVSFGYIGLDTIAFLDNSIYSFQIKKPTVLSNNHTAFLQNTSGTIAYLGDIPTPISLTTIGDSGPATLIGSVLNIPEYAGGGSAYTFSSPLSESLGVVSISQASTISNGYLSLSDFNTFNDKQDSITLTTTGSSGPSTFIANVLNIPEYTLSSLGGVPYIGATQNVDLGEYELKAGQIHFDQTPTGAAGVGIMRWNNTDGTVDLGLKGGNVTLQIGQELVLRVVNKTGSDITNGQVVRVVAVTGGVTGIALAQADSDANSVTTIGIATEDIANNAQGFVTTQGLVHDVNTNAFNEGDVLYLSPTIAGGLTNVKPIAPQHLVTIGYVAKKGASDGHILLHVQNGYELDELHDVKISSATGGEVLTYNGVTQVWENKKVYNDLQIRRNGITIFDDLIGTAANDNFQKLTFNSGSWSVSTISNENNPGVIAITSSVASASSGGNIIPSSSVSPRNYAVGVGMQYDLIMRTNALSANVIMRFGIIAGTTNATQPSDGVYLRLNNNDLVGQTANASVRSQTSAYTGISATTWYHFRVKMVSSSLAVYELYNMDGTLLWTDSLTTNLPNIGGGVQPTFIAYNQIAEARQICQVDYISFTYPPMNRGALI